jgi:hypothetical protein
MLSLHSCFAPSSPRRHDGTPRHLSPSSRSSKASRSCFGEDKWCGSHNDNASIEETGTRRRRRCLWLETKLGFHRRLPPRIVHSSRAIAVLARGYGSGSTPDLKLPDRCASMEQTSWNHRAVRFAAAPLHTERSTFVARHPVTMVPSLLEYCRARHQD